MEGIFTSSSLHSPADWWTTKCKRCPEALESFNEDASNTNPDVLKIAICCGHENQGIDEVRNILHDPEDPRWSNLDHYFIDFSAKEEAKCYFGFEQVPFFQIIDDSGSVVQSDNNPKSFKEGEHYRFCMKAPLVFDDDF